LSRHTPYTGALGFGGRLATVGHVDGVYRNEIDLQDLHANRHVAFGVSNSRLSPGGPVASVRSRRQESGMHGSRAAHRGASRIPFRARIHTGIRAADDLFFCPLSLSTSRKKPYS